MVPVAAHPRRMDRYAASFSQDSPVYCVAVNFFPRCIHVPHPREFDTDHTRARVRFVNSPRWNLLGGLTLAATKHRSN